MFALLFALFAPFSPKIDLFVSHLFYSPESGFYDNFFFSMLFKYGELFGLATGGIAAGTFLLSLFPQWKKLRRGSLAILLTLVIGAGVITNSGFKEHWGRPRPKQVIEFGGKHAFRPFWHPDFNTKNDPQKSFPSGHAAMGFYFLSLCFLGRRRQSKLLFSIGLFFTLLLGVGLMVARVAQGGHFVSDVLASFVLMWYVAKWIDMITWAGSAQPVLSPARHGTSQELGGT